MYSGRDYFYSLLGECPWRINVWKYPEKGHSKLVIIGATKVYSHKILHSDGHVYDESLVDKFEGVQ